MSAHVEDVIDNIPGVGEGGEDKIGQEDLWNCKLRLKIFVPVFVLVIISSVQVVTMGFCLKKNLLIENDEDFFIVQLIVVPLIGVLRVSFALRRSTTLPFSIISTFVLPPCFAFILGILAVSFINESFLLAAGVKCSLFVIFKVFNFCADLPICFGGFLGSFSHIELPRELVLYAVVTRSLKSVLVLPPQIFGPFGPPKKRVNFNKINQRHKCVIFLSPICSLNIFCPSSCLSS